MVAAKEKPKTEIIDKALTEAKKQVEIDDMPLTTFREYLAYNEAARQANKKLKILRYDIKQCPEELHPKQRLVFSHVNGSRNPLPVHLSNHLIHYDEILKPGVEYDVPECVINHLESKGHNVWDWVDLPNGDKETQVIDREPRFAIRAKSIPQG